MARFIRRLGLWPIDTIVKCVYVDGMYQLTNVPTATSALEIKGIVNGENVKIVCAKRNAAPDDWVMMTDTYVGDHMLAAPAALRQMYANDLAMAIRMARDAGYEQAKAEIRQVLGVKAT
jgi:hypothetical protein